jgi:RNA recognition motif. (a.k.a. RRM, RBD, or RNP domain)
MDTNDGFNGMPAQPYGMMPQVAQNNMAGPGYGMPDPSYGMMAPAWPMFDPEMFMKTMAGFQAANYQLAQLRNAQLGTAQADGPPKELCVAFKTYGFCPNTSCPYDHPGSLDNPLVGAPNELEASQTVQPVAQQQVKTKQTRRKRETRHIMVLHIPPEYYNETAVRDYFSKFGNILSIELHDEQRIAVVEYDINPSAYKALTSPDVIFGNRFVHVKWYNGNLPTPRNFGGQPNQAQAKSTASPPAQVGDEASPAPDTKATEKRTPLVSEETLKANLEMLARRGEEVKRDALERQKLEADKAAIARQRRKLEAEIRRMNAKIAGVSDGPEPDIKSESVSPDVEKTVTRENLVKRHAMLKAQLASLEAGNTPPAGHYIHSAGQYQAFRGPSVARLDNRPRSVSVRVVDSTPQNIEKVKFTITVSSHDLGIKDDNTNVCKEPTIPPGEHDCGPGPL